MNTLPYVCGIDQKIKLGAELYFGQLWDGNGDSEELLDSGSICLGEDENQMPVIVAFEIVGEAMDILNAVVRVMDVY